MSLRTLIFLVVSVIAGLGIAFLYQNISYDTENQQSLSSEDNLIQIVPELSDDDRVLWEGSDEVVVVEYFDIDCPYCRSLLLEEDKLPESVKNKVRLVYRWFPLLDIYPNSLDRAVIAECVAFTSGDAVFFDFLRVVSRLYKDNEENNDWLIAMAKPLVNDIVYFDECVSKKLSLEKINRDRAGAYVSGIFSVPSFLVSHKGIPVEKFDLLGPISGANILRVSAKLE